MKKNMDTRRLSATAQEDLRRRVVQSVIEQRMSKAVAARTFGVSRTSVHHWVSKYHMMGETGLMSRTRGRPRRLRLKEHRATAVVSLIKDFCPDQLDLPFALWNRKAVGRLIEIKYGLQLSVTTIGRYLNRWNFTPQKPHFPSFGGHPRIVKRWLKEEYPAIRRHAKRENIEIRWCEVKSLSPQRPVMPYNGCQEMVPSFCLVNQDTGYHMISAITSHGRLVFMVSRGRFEVGILIQFLQRLLKQSKRQMCLIAEGHPVYRYYKVQQWLEKHRRQLLLIQLPGNRTKPMAE